MAESKERTGNQLGKRYRCETCGTELLCLSRGDGTFECHGAAMTVVEVKSLPSSD
jgi:hypothetical protein